MKQNLTDQERQTLEHGTVKNLMLKFKNKKNWMKMSKKSIKKFCSGLLLLCLEGLSKSHCMEPATPSFKGETIFSQRELVSVIAQNRFDCSKNDLIALFSVTKFMVSLWSDNDAGFLKDNILDFKNHKYFVGDMFEGPQMRQWIFLNEGNIDRLSKGLSIKFVKPENRACHVDNEVKIESQLSAFEILAIQKDLYHINKFFPTAGLSIYSFYTRWLLFYSQAVLLGKANQYCGTNKKLQAECKEIALGLEKILVLSKSYHEDLVNKWKENFHKSCVTITHPEAALLFSLLKFSKKSLRFNITIKDENFTFHAGLIKYYTENIDYKKEHEKHRECFELAINEKVPGAIELYQEACQYKDYKYLQGLRIK